MRPPPPPPGFQKRMPLALTVTDSPGTGPVVSKAGNQCLAGSPDQEQWSVALATIGMAAQWIEASAAPAADPSPLAWKPESREPPASATPPGPIAGPSNNQGLVHPLGTLSSGRGWEIRKALETASASAAQRSGAPEQMQCTACKKWRHVEGGVACPETWTCSHDASLLILGGCAATMGKAQGGLLIGRFANYPEEWADSAIAEAEGVSRTTIWRRRQRQLAMAAQGQHAGHLSGTKKRERNVQKSSRKNAVQKVVSEEVGM